MSDLIQEVKTKKAPEAIGPYSQGVIAEGEQIFLSGQIPLDPKTNKMVPGGIIEQTTQVLKNMRNILQSQALNLDHVLKTTVYMVDLGQFNDMNKVYGEFFSKPYPARTTIQVVALPKGALVEIDAIAIVHHD